MHQASSMMCMIVLKNSILHELFPKLADSTVCDLTQLVSGTMEYSGNFRWRFGESSKLDMLSSLACMSRGSHAKSVYVYRSSICQQTRQIRQTDFECAHAGADQSQCNSAWRHLNYVTSRAVRSGPNGFSLRPAAATQWWLDKIEQT